ncbi:MAG: flavodoxin [Clostridia bacterium]
MYGNRSADLFAIEPVEPYTDADSNWTNSDSRVRLRVWDYKNRF